MASKYFGDLKYSVREYEKDGEKKKVWNKAGAVFQNEKTGRLSVKFESLPFGIEGWSGWMSIFPADNDSKEKKSQDVAPTDIDDKPIDLSEIPF